MKKHLVVLLTLMTALLLCLTACNGGNEPTETVTEEWVTENPDMHLGNDENFTWESFVPFS